uniref:MaoC-like domain-containing protein n=1 Tax=Caenorhabditis tropicalis TaxID=1561998 RepID=A0A1I7T323_9PELO
MDKKTACAHVPEPSEFEYTTRDAIIYALGVGARAKEDLCYVYENHEDFKVLPSFIVAPGFLAHTLMDWPGVEFDLQKVLHGEQYIEVLHPLPADGKLKSEARVVDILDKGSGALILGNVTTYDEQGKKVAIQQFSTFQTGYGNFGGDRTSPHEFKAAAVPDRAPDAVIEQKTSVDQAALYRLGSGDMNPLHVDPQFAKVSGFKTPILHGLCSLGFATRHVIAAWAGNDSNKFKAIKVRFSSPVLPGQTLVTETWKNGNRILFQVKVKETGKVVISNAYVDLTEASELPTVPADLVSKL